jgi:endonuclease YncB( thermonuclease family)
VRAWLLALLWLGPLASHADTYQARVVRIRDGDSLDVRAGAQTRALRLAEIDAPERSQPWGARAKRALAALVGGRDVRVELVEIDAYGREVSKLWVDGACVACALVQDGNAWVYTRYARDPALRALERQAREAARGLWSLPVSERVPPWEWRHAHAPRGD